MSEIIHFSAAYDFQNEKSVSYLYLLWICGHNFQEGAFLFLCVKKGNFPIVPFVRCSSAGRPYLQCSFSLPMLRLLSSKAQEHKYFLKNI